MINKELSKGSTSLLVLSVLSKEAMYGYQMIKELEERSAHVFALKEGTLYPLLHLLEQKGYLEVYWEVCNGRRRKYYKLTENGSKELEKEKKEWSLFSEAVTKVVQSVS